MKISPSQMSLQSICDQCSAVVPKSPDSSFRTIRQDAPSWAIISGQPELSHVVPVPDRLMYWQRLGHSVFGELTCAVTLNPVEWTRSKHHGQFVRHAM